jgi:hypothetical protein
MLFVKQWEGTRQEKATRDMKRVTRSGPCNIMSGRRFI